MMNSVIAGLTGNLLLRYFLKPLHHSEHYAHRDEAESCEYCPAHPLLWEGIEHCHSEGDEEVTDSGSCKPESLADTLKMTRSDLRYE